MELAQVILVVLGLSLFEVVSSVDNAIINAEVLSTMQEKSRKWFLSWGLLIAVIAVRGFLPWLIVFLAAPRLGIIGSFTVAFSNNSESLAAVESSGPLLLAGGGTFLLFLFFYWLFVEEKHYGLFPERFFHKQAVWFYAVVSVLLAAIVWFALAKNPFMAFSAVVGSTAFFIVHGFKEYAGAQEKRLLTKERSDTSKLLYLEIIDATFSIDGVLGAFAFTLSVPLILLGNGLGALFLRQLTITNIERIKKYVYLKNGAMYSIFFLGVVMLLDSFGHNVPFWLSPLITFAVVGFFFLKSQKAISV